MEKKHLKLGDLVSLEGLEKPGEGVLTVELGGKKVNQLRDKMSDLAGNIEDHQDVTAGEVAGLVEGLKNTLIRELSPERTAELLAILKKRFEAKDKPYKSAEGVAWNDLQKKLEASSEKLWSLNEMEKTGGKPDVMDYDKKTGEYIFMDCSAESPEGRRNCVYDKEGEATLKRDYPNEKYDGNAVSRAALMGVNLLSGREYQELQTKGEFDKKGGSWLKIPAAERRTGFALSGVRDGNGVRIFKNSPRNHFDSRGFRSSLRV